MNRRRSRPRNGSELLGDHVHEGSALLRRLAVEADALKLKREEMVGIEAWIDLLEFKETAEHQSRPDQQNEREGHFRHHHGIAKNCSTSDAGGSADAAQYIHQRGP